MSNTFYDDYAARQHERIKAKCEVQAKELEMWLLSEYAAGPARALLDSTITGHQDAHPLERLHALRSLRNRLIQNPTLE